MSDQLPAINMTTLAQFVNVAMDSAQVTKMTCSTFLRDMIEGQDVCGQLLAKAIHADIKAKAKLEYAESVAYLEKASEYLKDRNLKDSSEARKQYIDMDKDVMTAKDVKAQTEALVALLKNKLGILRQSHDDVKKVLYGDQHMTSFEGM